MDAAKLKLYAKLLEQAISDNLGKSKDVDWLAQYSPLLKALEDAKWSRIDQPRDLGLGRWELESNIQDIKDVSHHLAQFELLLEDWPLSSESAL